MQKKSCLLSVQHCTAFLPISHTNNTAITLTLKGLTEKKWHSLPHLLSPLLFQININLSSVRVASVLSDIISSYLVHMQMKDYILYMSTPLCASRGWNITSQRNKRSTLKTGEKKRRKNMQYYFVSKTFFNHHFSKGFFFLNKSKRKYVYVYKKD